jgi:hypothetical protein
MEESAFHPRHKTSNHFNMVSSSEPSFSAELNSSLNPALYVINEQPSYLGNPDLMIGSQSGIHTNILGSIKKGYQPPSVSKPSCIQDNSK